MTHTLTLYAPHFVQALKDVAVFASKVYGDLAHLCLSIQPRIGKLTLSASDGKGYIARTIPLVQDKGAPRASLPAKTIYLAPAEVAMLVKFVPARDYGNVVMQISDSVTQGRQYPARLTLASGGSTTFNLPADVSYPDLSAVIRKAERAKQAGVAQAGIYLPVFEMARVSKVLPKANGETVAVYSCKNNRDSNFCLIDYAQDYVETRVVFITSGSNPAVNNKPGVAKAA